MTLEQALERIADLEDQLAHCIYARPYDVAKLQRALSVTLSQAYIVSALYRTSMPLTTTDLDTLVPSTQNNRCRKDPEFRGDKTIQVQIHLLRRKYGRTFIETQHEMGYRLSDAGRGRVREALAA